MTAAHALALAAAALFGAALVTSRIGLRALAARAGAAISIPTATLLFVVAAPWAFDAHGADLRAAALFAGVGLFFPALVTLLTFRANRELGPTVTASLSGTSALFALGAGAVLLDERVPPQALLCAAAVVVGVALLAGPRAAPGATRALVLLLWPLAGAAVRGLAQVAAKAGLELWPSPFAAGLIGYLVSSAVVLGAGSIARPQSPRRTGASAAWFAATGVLNGSAVLLMYAALSRAPVAQVAPLVATYPAFAAILGVAVLRDERLTPRVGAGAGIVVLAVILLLASAA